MRWLIIMALGSAVFGVGYAAHTEINFLRAMQVIVYGRPWISSQQFYRLRYEMTHEDASRVLGGPGMEISSTRIISTTEEFVMTSYAWHNADGSSVVLVFRDDRLVDKARVGINP